MSTGSASFLFPEGRTVPLRGAPPSMMNLASGKFLLEQFDQFLPRQVFEDFLIPVNELVEK
jgi:hypothetical protein